jgi:hypothetical protein
VSFEESEKRSGFPGVEPLRRPTGAKVIFAVEQHVVERTLRSDDLGRQPTQQLCMVTPPPSVSADVLRI